MRSALLPFSGDPFLLTLWMDQFIKTAYDEVDELIIHMNGYADQEVVAMVRHIARYPKVRFMHTPSTVTHGQSIDAMLSEATGEYIVLFEEDAPILMKGEIDYHFKVIEKGTVDFVGSKRGSCSIELLEQAKQHWGLDYSGYGDQGCNFWPCFVFTKREILGKTDRNFDSKQWKAGTYIPELNWTPEVDIYGDTFVNTSLQIRSKNYRIMTIPQNHCYTDDLPDYQKKRGIFTPNTPWIHIGSLSSCFNGALTDDQFRALGRRKVEEPKGKYPITASTEGEKMEWERRLIWLFIGLETYSKSDWITKQVKDMFEPFYVEYGAAINRAIVAMGLNRDRMNERGFIYKELLNRYV